MTEEKQIRPQVKEYLEGKGWLDIFNKFTGGELGAMPRRSDLYDYQFPYVAQRRIYATSAAIAIATLDELVDDFAQVDDDIKLPPIGHSEFEAWREAAIQFDLPEIPPPPGTGLKCQLCQGKGLIIECEKCQGDGYWVCDVCNAEHHCDVCGGRGSVGIDRDHVNAKDAEVCPECGGTGERTYESCVQILNHFVDYRFYELMKSPHFTEFGFIKNKGCFVAKGPELGALIMCKRMEDGKPADSWAYGYYADGSWNLPRQIISERRDAKLHELIERRAES